MKLDATPKVLRGAVLFVIAMAAGWLLLQPNEGRARPKRPQVEALSCSCWCDSGPTGSSEITISNVPLPVLTCQQLNDRTCNREDPVSGGIRSGTLQGCAHTSVELFNAPSPTRPSRQETDDVRKQ